MTFLLIALSLAVVAGLASLVHAVRHAPEGIETEQGFSPRPARRMAVSRSSDDHSVLHGSRALLH